MSNKNIIKRNKFKYGNKNMRANGLNIINKAREVANREMVATIVTAVTEGGALPLDIKLGKNQGWENQYVVTETRRWRRSLETLAQRQYP